MEVLKKPWMAWPTNKIFLEINFQWLYIAIINSRYA